MVDQEDNRRHIIQKALREALVANKSAILHKVWVRSSSIPPSPKELEDAFANMLEKLL